jgi:hypothetical protein
MRNSVIVPTRRQTLCVFAVIAGAVATGTACDRSGANYVRVRGRVLVDGQPAEGAKVTFVARNGGVGIPSGKVEADGAFRLWTFDPDTGISHEGAPVGEYTVLATWVPDPTAETLEGGAADKLGNRYRDPRTSELRAEIREDTKELPEFRLTAAKQTGKR